MGRIMSFGQDGRMVRDFDKSDHDFLRRCGRTPDEIMAENAKLRQQLANVTESMGRVEERCAKLREELEFERSENGWSREFLNRMGRKCGTKDCPSLVAYVTKIESDNAKLSELVDYMTPIAWYAASERERDRMRELGMEVQP